MSNDPELKAMSAVFDALSGLNADTRERVVDWVMTKLSSSSGGAKKTGAKRGRKPSAKAAAKKTTGAKRGPKPGSKRGPKPGAKRSRKPGAAKKAGKRGRPAGSGNKPNARKAAAKTAGKRRGRPRKSSANAGSQSASA